MNVTFWKAVKGSGVSINLNDFEPQGGYELFLKTLCAETGETFIKWYQGIESGIGNITYKGYTLTVFWTDFPFALSFDCRDEAMALEFKEVLIHFFDKNPNYS